MRPEKEKFGFADFIFSLSKSKEERTKELEQLKDKLIYNICRNLEHHEKNGCKHLLIMVSHGAYKLLNSDYEPKPFQPSVSIMGYRIIKLDSFPNYLDFRIVEIKEPIYETETSE
jgi:phosphoglycerol transferase MdoB-like AlkP superfamily enzyme